MCVVGARPNLMKIAPLMHAFDKRRDEILPILIHTGQHYDVNMDEAFFKDLAIPKPDINLKVGSGSHAEQTAKIMLGFEQVLLENTPELVVVVGDVNSTLACTITAAKLGIPVAHVEAGLRSFDRSMPEEINRLVTDSLCAALFTTEESANRNLRNEGIADERIYFVGNVMIDTLARCLDLIKNMPLSVPGIHEGGYATLTLHRPSNVDDREVLEDILSALEKIQLKTPIIFPVHPRTRKQLDKFELWEKLSCMKGILTTEPMGYIEFLRINRSAKFILTDSGGLQEESTFLGIPCLTLRENTERPSTVELGTNVLTGSDPERILEAYDKIERGIFKKGVLPPLWDGHASERIAEKITVLSL